MQAQLVRKCYPGPLGGALKGGDQRGMLELHWPACPPQSFVLLCSMICAGDLQEPPHSAILLRWHTVPRHACFNGCTCLACLRDSAPQPLLHNPMRLVPHLANLPYVGARCHRAAHETNATHFGSLGEPSCPHPQGLSLAQAGVAASPERHSCKLSLFPGH